MSEHIKIGVAIIVAGIALYALVTAFPYTKPMPPCTAEDERLQLPLWMCEEPDNPDAMMERALRQHGHKPLTRP